MKKIYILSLITVLCLVALACSKSDADFTFRQQDANISGKITAFETGNAIAGAKITLNPGTFVYSDINGNYVFNKLFLQAYSLTYEVDNYRTETREVLAKGDRHFIFNNIMVADTTALATPQAAVTVADTLLFGTMIIKRTAPIDMAWQIDEASLPANITLADACPGSGIIKADENTGDAGEQALTFAFARGTLRPGNTNQKVKILIGEDAFVEQIFTVDTYGEGAIFVTPTILDFGDWGQKASFTIHNIGAMPLDWAITSADTLISFDPANGFGMNSIEVNVTLNRTDLAVANYTSTANVGGAGAPAYNSTALTLTYNAVSIELVDLYDIEYRAEDIDGTYPSSYENQNIMVRGVVNAVSSRGFYITHPDGGEWNGLYVFDVTNAPVMGDYVQFTGLLIEYYGLTEMKNLMDNYTIISSDNPIPAPIEVATNTFATAGEPYENVLVKFVDVTVTHINDEYGQWYVDDGSGMAQLDDSFFKLADVGIVLEVGMKFDEISGIGSYSYEEYELSPRTVDDMVFSTE